MTTSNRQDKKSSQLTEMEKVLGRIVLRLTLATSGLDPSLDPHLKALRNATRKGVNPNSLQLLTELSEQLVRADGERESKDRQQDSDSNPLINVLVPRIQLTGSKATRFRQLGEKLSSTLAPPSDEDLDEFLQLLVGEQSSGRRPGFFSRLFAGNDDDGGELESPNMALRRLLEKIEWPEQLANDVRQLLEQLGPRSPGNYWEEALRRLVSTLASALGEARTELRATESFLSELNSRLVEIDRYVTQGEERRAKAQQGSETLGRDVNQQVGDIRDDMREAQNIEQLRLGIDKHLDKITASVEEFVQGQTVYHQEVATAETRLRGELEVVESEARELRRKVIEAHRQAATDSVTGLPNRMAYEERLNQEFARWKRFDEPLTMLVWDVDDFKKINDRFGHQSGDKALRVIAQQLKKTLRETDFVARFGGEEFAMLLAGTSKEDAIRLADSIRKSVNDSGFHSSGSRVSVTISCGIGEFNEGDTPDSVFRRADNALYEAKRAGKDRVVAL